MEDETTVDVPETSEEELVEIEEEESVEDVKAKLEKANELADNYKTRAEKAEKKAKAKPAASNDSGLSAQDLLALSKADIENEDLDDVLDYAKYKGVSISEALQTTVMKATLSDKAELRKSAEATATGSTRRGSAQVSDERLLADASAGNLPSSDADMNRLAKLKITNK